MSHEYSRKLGKYFLDQGLFFLGFLPYTYLVGTVGYIPFLGEGLSIMNEKIKKQLDLGNRLIKACNKIRESGRWDTSSKVANRWLQWDEKQGKNLSKKTYRVEVIVHQVYDKDTNNEYLEVVWERDVGDFDNLEQAQEFAELVVEKTGKL